MRYIDEKCCDSNLYGVQRKEALRVYTVLPVLAADERDTLGGRSD